MKNPAFTMIELVFVIIILGILAAVAIPKLSATRNDAIVSKTATAVSTAAMEIATYGMANGQIENDMSAMSNSVSSLVNSGDATLNIGQRAVDFKMGSVLNCLRLQVDSSGSDENLTLVRGPRGDSKCNSLQDIFPNGIYPISLRGVKVVH